MRCLHDLCSPSNRQSTSQAGTDEVVRVEVVEVDTLPDALMVVELVAVAASDPIAVARCDVEAASSAPATVVPAIALSSPAPALGQPTPLLAQHHFISAKDHFEASPSSPASQPYRDAGTVAEMVEVGAVEAVVLLAGFREVATATEAREVEEV